MKKIDYSKIKKEFGLSNKELEALKFQYEVFDPDIFDKIRTKEFYSTISTGLDEPMFFIKGKRATREEYRKIEGEWLDSKNQVL